jgi:hypothetical protein
MYGACPMNHRDAATPMPDMARLARLARLASSSWWAAVAALGGYGRGAAAETRRKAL